MALQPFLRPQEPEAPQMQRLRNAGLRLLAQQAGSSPGRLAGAGCPPPAGRRLHRAAGAAQSPVSSPTSLAMVCQSLSVLWQQHIPRQQQRGAWPETTQLQQV